MPISRLQAAHLAAVIADRLNTERAAEAFVGLAQLLMSGSSDQPSRSQYDTDVLALCGEEHVRTIIEGVLRSCYPAALAPDMPAFGVKVAGDDGLGTFWTVYEIGKELGGLAEKSGFNDWWWESNYWLDERFFNWLNNLGTESFPPGDYPLPPQIDELPA